MEEKRELRTGRPVVSRTVSDAVEQILVDAADAGVTLDDIESNTKYGGKFVEDQKALDELVDLKRRGAAIPGQSLTSDLEQPRPWERPPEFANPREALNHITSLILKPDSVKELLAALTNGASVGDIAMSIVYSQYAEGKISPQTMLLTMEPVMYVIMGIAEEADVNYTIDGDNIEEADEDEIREQLNEFESAVSKISKETAKKNITLENMPSNILDKSLLDKVKEAVPQARKSLLDKGETNE